MGTMRLINILGTVLSIALSACAIGTAKCNNERIACVNDADGNQCDTCGEFFNTGAQNFCAGSQAKAQALLDCVCTVGVCAE